ncbi:MAG TPA: hypothetical protein VGW33_11220 [Terriglobia bacterium]|nr:hypothetical protein [Terriglobia bacterium]
MNNKVLGITLCLWFSVVAARAQDPNVTTNSGGTAGNIPVWNGASDIEKTTSSLDGTVGGNLFVGGPIPYFSAAASAFGVVDDEQNNNTGTVPTGGASVTATTNVFVAGDVGKLIGISGAGFAAPTGGALSTSTTGSPTLPAGTYYVRQACVVGTVFVSSVPTEWSVGLASTEKSQTITSGQNLTIGSVIGDTNCSMQNGETATAYALYVGAGLGTVNVTGTGAYTVTWVSGQQFSPAWASGTININGVPCTVSSTAPTSTSLTVVSGSCSLSTPLSGVTYSFGSLSERFISAQDPSVQCIAGTGVLSNYCTTTGTATISAPIAFAGARPPLQAEWRTTIASVSSPPTATATLTDKAPTAETFGGATVSWGTNNDQALITLNNACFTITSGSLPGCRVQFSATQGSATHTGRVMVNQHWAVTSGAMTIQGSTMPQVPSFIGYLGGIQGVFPTQPSVALVSNADDYIAVVTGSNDTIQDMGFIDVAGTQLTTAVYGNTWGAVEDNQTVGFNEYRTTNVNFTRGSGLVGYVGSGTVTQGNHVDYFNCILCYNGIFLPSGNSDWLIDHFTLSGPGNDTNSSNAVGILVEGADCTMTCTNSDFGGQTDTINIMGGTMRNYPLHLGQFVDCKNCVVSGPVRVEDVNAGMGVKAPSGAVWLIDGGTAQGGNSNCKYDIVENINSASSGGYNTGIQSTLQCTNAVLGPMGGLGGTTPIMNGDTTNSSVVWDTSGITATALTATSLSLTSPLSPANGGVAQVTTSGVGYFVPVFISVPITNSGASLVGMANEPDFFEFVLPFTATATNVAFHISTAGGTGTHCDIGMFNTAGVRLWHTGSIDCNQNSGDYTQAVSGGSVTMNPGTYYFATCADSTVPKLNGSNIVFATAGSSAIVPHTWGADAVMADNCTAGVLPSSIMMISNIANSTLRQPIYAWVTP